MQLLVAAIGPEELGRRAVGKSNGGFQGCAKGVVAAGHQKIAVGSGDTDLLGEEIGQNDLVLGPLPGG